MRVWHQGFFELEAPPVYIEALSYHVGAVASPRVTVDFHGFARGKYIRL